MMMICDPGKSCVNMICKHRKPHERMLSCARFCGGSTCREYKMKIEDLTDKQRYALLYAYEYDKLTPKENMFLESSGILDCDLELCMSDIHKIIEKLQADSAPMKLEDGKLILNGVTYSKETLLENLQNG